VWAGAKRKDGKDKKKGRALSFLSLFLSFFLSFIHFGSFFFEKEKALKTKEVFGNPSSLPTRGCGKRSAQTKRERERRAESGERRRGGALLAQTLVFAHLPFFPVFRNRTRKARRRVFDPFACSSPARNHPPRRVPGVVGACCCGAELRSGGLERS
jgi:hypothetical protein